MSKHTRGPWSHSFVSREAGSLVVADGRGPNICRVLDDPSLDLKEIEANANLISAAPELLEYLEYALVYVQAEPHPFAQNIATRIRAIITKAEGKTS